MEFNNEDAILIKANLRRDGKVDSFNCPICNKQQESTYQHKKHMVYCWHCGQKLRWGKWKWKNKG